MSFFTSFCDLPQKEQQRLPLESSRRRSTFYLSLSICIRPLLEKLFSAISKNSKAPGRGSQACRNLSSPSALWAAEAVFVKTRSSAWPPPSVGTIQARWSRLSPSKRVPSQKASVFFLGL